MRTLFRLLQIDKASGQKLIQDLKKDGAWNIRAYQPLSYEKIMRVYDQTAKFEARRVIFPESAPWLKDYVDELLL